MNESLVVIKDDIEDNQYHMVSIQDTATDNKGYLQVHIPMYKIIPMLGYLQANNFVISKLKPKRNALLLNDLVMEELNNFNIYDDLTYHQYLNAYQNRGKIKVLMPTISKAEQYHMYSLDEVVLRYGFITINISDMSKVAIYEKDLLFGDDTIFGDEMLINIKAKTSEGMSFNKEQYQEDINRFKQIVEEFLNNFN